MAFRWRADNGPLIVAFGSSLPSSTNPPSPKKKTEKKKKKKRRQRWTPLTKNSGSAHVESTKPPSPAYECSYYTKFIYSSSFFFNMFKAVNSCVCKGTDGLRNVSTQPTNVVIIQNSFILHLFSLTCLKQ